MKLNFWKKEASYEEVNNNMEGMPHTINVDEPEVEGRIESPGDNIYKKLSRYVLYAGVFLVPLFFLTISTNILDVNKSVLLLLVTGIVLVTWLLSIVSSGWMTFRRNFVDYGVLAFVVSMAVATIFSIDRFGSLFGSNISLSASLFTLVVLSIYYLLVVNTYEDRATTFRSVFGLSLVLALFYGLLQVFGLYLLKFDFSTSSAFNTVGSVNSLGLLAAISLPYLNKMSVDLRYLKNAHLDKIGTVLALVLLLIINWQVLWIVAIAGMVGIVVFDAMRGERFKVAKILLPMTVIVLGVFMMIVNFDFSNIRNDLPVEVAPSFGLSRDIAASTLGDHPLFGYGPENYVIAFDRYGASTIANSSLSNVRFFDGSSEFMNLIVQGGILAIIAFAFLIFALAKAIMKFKAHCSEYIGSEFLKEDAGVYASLVAALTGYFFYPYNLTLMFVLYTLIALAVIIAWGKNLRHYNIEEKTSLSLISSLAFIGGLILVLIGSYFGGTYYLADVKYAKALTVDNNEDAAVSLVEAINLNNNDDRFYRTASQVALNLLSAQVNNTEGSVAERNQRIQNLTASAVSFAQSATQISPENAVNWVNLGNVYQNLLTLVDGADSLAENAFLKAAELRPGDANYYNRIGMLYLSEYELLRRLAPRTNAASLPQLIERADGALVKSAEYFQIAIDISPNFGVAIYNLGAVYDRQGRVKESIRELEKIIQSNRNQPGLNFELGLLYYRDDRKADALQQLEFAILLAPEYSNARWYAALIYEEQGNIDKAIEYLEIISNLDINAGNDVLAAKLEQLRAGIEVEPPVDVLDQEPIN